MKCLHKDASQLGWILAKLKVMKNEQEILYDVLIVGGGPGGLSCALSIARGGERTILICDDGRPRNRNAEGIHNLPGHEGIPPKDYLDLLRNGLLNYPHVVFENKSVVEIEKIDPSFISTLEDGRKVQSRKVVLAEGLIDILPEIPGIKELWGRSVFHCAYCHGYENVGKEFGILVSNRKSIQMIRLIKGLSGNISIFTNGKVIFEEHELAEFRQMDMRIFNGSITSLKMTKDQKLAAINLLNFESVICDTLFIQNKTKPRSLLGSNLGCEMLEDGTYYVDGDGQSNVGGVYFAGDVGSKYHSVIMASAVGSHVGICVNAHIMKNKFGHTNCSDD